jgi:hypothetical protein
MLALIISSQYFLFTVTTVDLSHKAFRIYAFAGYFTLLYSYNAHIALENLATVMVLFK